jgi:fumarate hydratase class II
MMRHTWRALLAATLTLIVSTGTALAQAKNANRAIEFAGDQKGSKKPIHPNDDVRSY